jgi:predicted ATP-dependent serine protease
LELLPCDHKGKNGIVTTGITLIGGIAGAGKSTLSLAMADAIAESLQREVLYIAAEEDEEAIKDRAGRIGVKNLDKIRVLSTLVGMQALGELEGLLDRFNPGAVFLDSVTGLMDKDLEGAVSICKSLKRITVRRKAPTIVIDQATKQDDFAGLYKLQHTVDTTMILSEREEFVPRKVSTLQVIKNRFGRAFVSLDLEMHENGLTVFEKAEDD